MGLLTLLLLLSLNTYGVARDVRIAVPVEAGSRVELGIQRLTLALNAVGLKSVVSRGDPDKTKRPLIIVRGTTRSQTTTPGEEGFVLGSIGDDVIEVSGRDETGLLYGCLELAQRIQAVGGLPSSLNVSETPAFKIRGPALGMQRPEIGRDGIVYDYLYTAEDFPFFYDKLKWTRYLDFLLDNRMNALFLWNGHPFTSLLKLSKYPDAQELSDTKLARNVEMFNWLTTEADRRGIWVIQNFYNIHISHALAKSRNLPITHARPSAIVAEYTRYAISEFMYNYRHVGLMLCLGEALQDEYDSAWLNEVIIPGVKDAMRALGTAKEPPIIVRAHATPIEKVLEAAQPLYGNIYTMYKYNGEGLTTTQPRGEVWRMNAELSRRARIHIINIHLLSNLEPFRWGAPSFVQKSMQSCQKMGVKGLHLYPLRYWDWPRTADAVIPPLSQIDRDWIWFESWARYAWNPNRDTEGERLYWVGRLKEKYGSTEAAGLILDAYEHSGLVLPSLVPRIGITTGGRQTFSQGMLMTQLINPNRYNPWTEMWEATAPPGERLEEWAEKEWKGEPHSGETPPQVVEAAVNNATVAVNNAEAAEQKISRNREEFSRFLNDLRCIQSLSLHYRSKVQAACDVLRYGYSRDIHDLEKAEVWLRQSVSEYRKLVELTDKTYLDSMAMHTVNRRIPFPSGSGRFVHWRQCLPEYESELGRFQRNLAWLKGSAELPKVKAGHRLQSIDVRLLTAGAEAYELNEGARAFSDKADLIQHIAPELIGLKGIRIAARTAASGFQLDFELNEPARMLIGFFQTGTPYAKPPSPELETEWDIFLINGVEIPSLPPMQVYSKAIPPGKSSLHLNGIACVLGFVKATEDLYPRAILAPKTSGKGIAAGMLDWLFE